MFFLNKDKLSAPYPYFFLKKLLYRPKVEKRIWAAPFGSGFPLYLFQGAAPLKKDAATIPAAKETPQKKEPEA